MPNVITTEQLAEKIELLRPGQRRKVHEFVLSLLGRREVDLSAGKRALLETSVWSDQDVRPIEEARQDVDKWRIPT